MYRFAMKSLQDWKDQPDRKPLVIRGARQVGKSSLARMFGDSHFDNVVEINFEQDQKSAGYFKTHSPTKTIALLEADQSTDIKPGKTLLFLDEIQAAPKVLASLRYFYEQMPKLHIVAAGSLLEFVLEDHSFSMPVGRIEYLHLGPMTFEEYLLAAGKEKRLDALRNFTITDESFASLHLAFMEDFRDYCVVGGMPAAIKAYIESNSYLTTERIQEGILATYRDDFSKYGKRVNHSRLQKVFSRLPLLVGQKFKYTNLDRQEQSRELAKAINMLELARVIRRVQHSDANGIPLGAEVNDRYFKTLFLDVGLLCRACGLSMTDVHNADDIMLINSGAVCEQFIGQHLLYAKKYYEEPQLYCWMRQKRNTSAEVDYLFQIGTNIVPIEVKAGKTGTLKSLHVFVAEKNRNFAIRFNADTPSILDTQTRIAGKTPQNFKLLSLPLYMIGQTQRLCHEII
ncbi:MAG: ATP-binding protein [Sedimentisphaerales bacterium]|nr:ATP-binding protein [Sedimentisphaerales bacterium]